MNSEAYRSIPVLVVDDDKDVLHAISDTLTREGYRVEVCLNALEAYSRIESGDFGLVIADNYMPGMTGLELLARVRDSRPLVTRVLITGMLAIDTLIAAINSGEIYRFIAKPWNAAELIAAVDNSLQRHHLLVSNQRLQEETFACNAMLTRTNADLEDRVVEVSRQKAALDAAHEALERNFDQSLDVVYRLISTFYGLLGTQIQKVVKICEAMVADEQFSPEERRVLRASSWLYDVGFLAFERSFIHRALNHSDRLSIEEKQLLKQHTVVGQTLAGFAGELDGVGLTIRSHHERCDGTGYPDGLRKENIPWTARCLAVAVMYVTSGLPAERALELILRESGTGLDPDAVAVFRRNLRTESLPRNVREVLVKELRPGFELADGVRSQAGMLLMPEGTRLLQSHIDKIMMHSEMHLINDHLLVYTK
jgi:response regulator RpfG family c-di-GMP phosphodiesterase